MKIYNFYDFNVLFKRAISRNCTVCPSEIDTMPRNMLLIKNPQFLPNFYGTLSKWRSDELIILAKCNQNWVQIVDFLLIAYFWAWCQFCLDILYPLHCLSVIVILKLRESRIIGNSGELKVLFIIWL